MIIIAHASLKSRIQCRDRSDPFSGEVIQPSLVQELSRCMNSAGKTQARFLSPLFFSFFNVSAKQFPSVKWLFPLLLSVDARARLFHPLWGVMGFCLAASPCCRRRGSAGGGRGWCGTSGPAR